jgi:hypothetical protein
LNRDNQISEAVLAPGPTRPSHCAPMFLVDKFKGLAGTLTPRQVAALDFRYSH